MIRVETKHLFSEGVSPHIKSLILKTRAGIVLNENEKKKLNRFNESLSMKEIPKNRKVVVPPNYIPQPDEDELEDMIDLDEILREMGYGDDEDTDDLFLLDKETLRDLIKKEVRNHYEEILKNDEDLDFNEIIENILKMDY